MHLLAAQPGTIQDGAEAIDLGQTPGDLLFISAADTDLLALSTAHAGLAEPRASLRLANAMQLQHAMSVDLHVEAMAPGVKLVVLRLLGGLAYWSYLVEQWQVAAKTEGFALAVLPADGKPDPALLGASTLNPEVHTRLSAYLDAGGAENARAFLTYASDLIAGRDSQAPEPQALPQAGILGHGSLTDWAHAECKTANPPIVPLIFYRAYVQAGDTAALEAMAKALRDQGLAPLPLYVSSLKEPASASLLEEAFAAYPPDLIFTTTGFALASPGTDERGPFAHTDALLLQAPLANTSLEAWQENPQGLGPKDLAMHAALTELDGRLFTRPLAFKSPGDYDPATQCTLARLVPEPSRIRFVAELARRWVELRRTAPAQRRIALILANYPNKDGRLANGVGLDTPASTQAILQRLVADGYDFGPLPSSSAALMQRLSAGPTNAHDKLREGQVRLDIDTYQAWLDAQPLAVRQAVSERWGPPQADPFVVGQAFVLPLHRLGQSYVGIQPARGYAIDPEASYHDPDLVPPHGYLATYLFLRQETQAIVHVGKHGNLEWLPGKALALSETCYPEVALGPMPQLYPFIVNDPGEGTQAKRRTAALIIDHLTPPLSRAEAYGPYAELERLVDEYYLAAGGDPRRLAYLKREILSAVQALELGEDLGVDPRAQEGETLEALDTYLCELKEMQIRDGLHILGQAPSGTQARDTLVALARVPRGEGKDADASLIRALAADLGLDFDPLDCNLGAPWQGPRPSILDGPDPWRTAGDTLERLEDLAARLVQGEQHIEPGWTHTPPVLAEIKHRFAPALAVSAKNELDALASGLAGLFVPPGPSGAPTRGRPDVLPTGRNFYSIDSRSLPTPAAWHLGWKSAARLLERYVQDEGDWPQRLALSAWGTANMRTGGDDLAQALALLGVKPTWEPRSGRVTGFEILPLEVLDRPRIDLTLRVSGFFRDAFPQQLDLIDSAVQAVASLDEPTALNPLAASVRAEAQALQAQGLSADAARRRASYRVFGSKPGAYGAGLQALIDSGGWQARGDLAQAYLSWSSYAYGGGAGGAQAADAFTARLSRVQAVLHNQDNREHDLLDSDDYYQFEGGLTAAVAELSGQEPQVYHNDHSRPESPRVRALHEEIGRVVRARAANPKWIAGVMRHGYKGAFEIAATLDYLFAFAATTQAVPSGHFDRLYEAYVADSSVRDWMAEVNPAALEEMLARFDEARERGLWQPKRNQL